MATWQFSVEIVPIERPNEEMDQTSKRPLGELCETSDLWSRKKQSADAVRAIVNSCLLNRKAKIYEYKGWSDKAIFWGTDDGNQIVMFIENDFIDSLSIRIDVGAISKQFLAGIVDICGKLDYGVVYSESTIIAPVNEAVLMDAILQSKAYEFVKSPKNYFEKLHRANLVSGNSNKLN